MPESAKLYANCNEELDQITGTSTKLSLHLLDPYLRIFSCLLPIWHAVCLVILDAAVVFSGI
jgi:hypothetical protein